jgi:hypothetical protein
MEEPAMKISVKTNNRLDRRELTPKFPFAVVAACMIVLSSVVTASADDSSRRPIALTESGVVIGATTDGVNQFLGIPYAAPPVGTSRWRPPRRYGFFPGFFLQATEFGSECTQAGGGSENCLFLNVAPIQKV